jgi:dCMP deaminase
VLVKDRRILSTGYNGFPVGLSDSLDLYQDREYKLAVTVHAEANAIINAAKNGAITKNCDAYVTFPPCSQCAAALIQAGVSKVICPDPADAPERWRASFKLANEMLYQSGVKLLYYSESELCQSRNAQCVELGGCRDNSTGPPVNPEKTSTSTPLSAADFLPKRLRDA